MKQVDFDRIKERYYPNFIQKRSGNNIYFLTEVVGGEIIRREVELNEKTIITFEIDGFLSVAENEARRVIMKQRELNDRDYDGTPYTIDNLPDGIDILDVMSEIKKTAYVGNIDGDVTEEEAEEAINMAVERKRAKEE